MESDRAPCEKCDTEISTDAERCPQCGHEPSDFGGFGTAILAVLSVLVAIVGAIIAVAGLAVLADGNVVSGMVGVLFGLGLMAPCGVVFWGSWKKAQATPTGA